MLVEAPTDDRNAEASGTSSPRSLDATSKVKGAGIRQFFEWYLGQRGSLGLAEIEARLDASSRSWFNFSKTDLGMLSASWYPAAAVHALLDVVLDGVPASERRQMAREGAEITIRSHLSGAYRFLFRAIMTPERYAKNADKIFHRYYDSGTLTKEELAPGRHLTVVRDWPGHHRFLCDLALYGSRVIYPEMGYRLTALERKSCIGDGDSYCSWITSWEV